MCAFWFGCLFNCRFLIWKYGASVDTDILGFSGHSKDFQHIFLLQTDT